MTYSLILCCRIAAAPSFPGLRRFPDGRKFAQWTGNDSRALMKVQQYPLDHPNIYRYQFIIRSCSPRSSATSPRKLFAAYGLFSTYATFFDNTLTTKTISTKLTRPLPNSNNIGNSFDTRTFAKTGSTSLVHYRFLIEEFGSPNGLCSSITESRHITAVKKPYRRSSRWKAMGQMLTTLQRLDKFSAARSDFTERGMLKGTAYSQAYQEISGAHSSDDDDDDESRPVDNPDAITSVELARTRGTYLNLLLYISSLTLFSSQRETIRSSLMT